MSSPLDSTRLSATQIARAVRARELTSCDVVEQHLERIEHTRRLNAVVQLSPTALDDARAADAAAAHGEWRGPLHGVPFTVKDWIETAGLVCAAGVEARRAFVPKRDATVVARLRAAGAVLLGKTKPGAAADVYPAPANPHDLERMPGGSSSGEAAIVAAGGSPLGLGSDSGGSIRWPAHCCGIAGLKPTSGLVPNTGHVPCISALADPRTVIGPLARRVDDLALTLPIIAGIDWCDAGVVPMPVGDSHAVDVSALRVAHFDRFEGAQPTAAASAAVDAAVAAIARVGARVTAAVPPRIEEALAITQAYWARPESLSWKTWQPWGASTLSADDVERSLFEWDRLRRAFLGFMAEFDLLVCPVAADAAPRRAHYDSGDFIYTLPFSLTGQPCVVVRAGTSDEGMPLGVQLVARHGCDHVALAAGRVVERALGEWPPPALLTERLG